MRFRNLSSVLMAVLAISLLNASSCSTGGALTYADATHNYNVTGTAYKTAFDKLSNLRAVGKVSDAQWQAFVTASATERTADTAVVADLATWQSTNAQPSSWSTDWQALQDAQAAVIQLANGVSL